MTLIHSLPNAWQPTNAPATFRSPSTDAKSCVCNPHTARQFVMHGLQLLRRLRPSHAHTLFPITTRAAGTNDRIRTSTRVRPDQDRDQAVHPIPAARGEAMPEGDQVVSLGHMCYNNLIICLFCSLTLLKKLEIGRRSRASVPVDTRRVIPRFDPKNGDLWSRRPKSDAFWPLFSY